MAFQATAHLLDISEWNLNFWMKETYFMRSLTSPLSAFSDEK